MFEYADERQHEVHAVEQMSFVHSQRYQEDLQRVIDVLHPRLLRVMTYLSISLFVVTCAISVANATLDNGKSLFLVALVFVQVHLIEGAVVLLDVRVHHYESDKRLRYA